MDSSQPPFPSPGSRPLYTSRRRQRRQARIDALRTVVAVVGGLIVIGALTWFWQRSRAGPEAPLEAPGTTTGPVDPRASPPPDARADAEAAGPIPTLEESDAVVRRLVGALSSHPRMASWLATDDLARAFVVSVTHVAHGVSPTSELPFRAPAEDFAVRTAGTGLVVDPASYRRYDPYVAAFASLDTEGTVRLYQRLRPLFQQVYEELGLGEESFDAVLGRAVERLTDVQPPDGPVRVELQEAVYAFSDPELEALSPPQKHLVRMGPENAGLIQAKLRELSESLGLERKEIRDDAPG